MIQICLQYQKTRRTLYVAEHEGPPVRNTGSEPTKSTHKLRNCNELVFSNTVPLKSIRGLKIPFKYHWIIFNGTWMVLGGIMAKGIWMVSEWFFEWYFGFFVPSSGIE